jgi:hypothetical protein
MAKYNTYDIMPIAMLGVKNYKLFFDIVEDLDRPLGELINGYVHPKSISGVLTALLAMGVYPIQLYKGRIREPESDIIKVSLLIFHFLFLRILIFCLFLFYFRSW